MKKNVFTYLFIATLLALVFVIITTKNNQKDVEHSLLLTIEQYENEIIAYQDSINTLKIENIVLAEFSLEDDAYAIEHLYKEGFDYKELMLHVEDEIISLNTGKEGNILVPYAAMYSDKMLVNSIKMLNHKWVIANFTDGKYWGQVLIECSYTKQKTVTFSTVTAFLYPIDVID